MTKKNKAGATFKLTPIAACVLISVRVLAQDPIPANSLPTGGAVNAGQAQWSVNGAQMVIDQASQRVDTSWSSFNIGRDAAVTVRQPAPSSQFIGRVTGSDASYIMGGLQANGQVVLVNPNGMVFGQDSQVNVGGLIASTQRLSALTREGAELQFTGPGGVLSQHGDIGAGYVALIGAEIHQDGSIRSSGDVAMASGDQVKLALDNGGRLTVSVDAAAVNASIDQTGTIASDNGTVAIQARAAQSLLEQAVSGAESAQELIMVDGKLQLVRSSGEISAEDIHVDSGDTGQTQVSGSLTASNVSVLGGAVGLSGTARIDVSAQTDAGQVQIGGSWQNKDESVRQAQTTRVEDGAVIRADSTEMGNAGQIVVWSNVQNPNSLTVVGGTLSARANQGSGGEIETSGATLELGQVDVSTGGSAGDGLWLLDPTIWNIGTSEAASIVSALASANVEITTTDSPPDFTSNGGNNVTETISVNAPIVSSSTAGNYLLLNSGGDVRVTEQISLASGDLTLIAGQDIWLHNTTNSSSDALVLSGSGATLTLSAAGQVLNTSTAPPADLSTVSGSDSSIDVDNLRLTGGGDFALLANTNSIGTLATDSVGVVRVNTESALTIGTVSTSGLSSSFSATNGSSSGIASDDLVQINTQSGDLSVTQAVSSSASDAQTVRLSAGQDESFNVETGGDVVFSGSGSVSTANVTTGPGALILTGSFAGSSSAAGLTGVENEHLRFSTNLGNLSSRLTFSDTTGIALAYREYPTASIILTNGSDGVIDAGENTHEYTAEAARTVYIPSDYQYRFVSSDFSTLDNDATLISRLESDVKTLAEPGDTSLHYAMLGRTASSAGHTNAGEYNIVSTVYQGFVDSSYTPSSSASWSEYTPSGILLSPLESTVTVTPKQLLIRSEVNDRVYNGSDVAEVNLLATGVDGTPIEGITDVGQNVVAQTFASGVVKADAVTIGATGVFDSKDVAYSSGSVVSQTVTITPSLTGADNGNYVFPADQTTTTATINRKSLSVSAAKEYDGDTTITNSQITVDTSSFVGTETVVLSGDATVDSKDVVTASELSDVSGLSLANGSNGGLAANYVLPSTISASVTPIMVGVDFTREYDTTRNTTLADMTLSNSAVSGESLLLGFSSGSLSTATLDRANVTLASGFSTFGNVELQAGSNTLASNYQLPAPADVNVTITPVELSPGYSAETKVYDGTTTVPGVSLTKTLAPFLGTELALEYTAAAYNDKDVADATTVAYSGGSITAVTDATPSNGALDDMLASDFTLPSSVDVTGTITPLAITGDDLFFQTSGALSGSTTVSGSDANLETLISGETLTLSVTGVSITENAQEGNWYVTNADLSGATINVNGSASSNYSLITSTPNDDYLVFGGQTLLTIAGTSSTFEEVYDGNTVIDNTEGYAFAWPSRRDLPEEFWSVIQVSDSSVIASDSTVTASGFLAGAGGGAPFYQDIHFDAAFDSADATDSANISVTDIRWVNSVRGDAFADNYQFVDADIAAKITRRPISVTSTLAADNLVAKEFDGTASIASEVSSTVAFSTTQSANEGVVTGDAVSIALNGDVLAKDRSAEINYNSSELIDVPANQQNVGSAFWASLGDFELTGADAANYEIEFETTPTGVVRDNGGDAILTGRLFIAPQAVSVSINKTYDATPVVAESDFSVSGPSGTSLSVGITDLALSSWEIPLGSGGANVAPDPDDAGQRQKLIDFGMADDDAAARSRLVTFRAEYDAAATFIADDPNPIRTGVVSGSAFSSAFGVSDSLSVTIRKPSKSSPGQSSTLPVKILNNGTETTNYCAFDCVSLSSYGVFANSTALDGAKTEQSLTSLTDTGYSTRLLLADSATTMAPLAITVTPTADQTKSEGQSDPTFTYSAGTLGSDTLTGSLGRAAGETVGDYAFTLGDLSNSNYSLTLASEVFGITATSNPSVTLTGVVVGQKTYDSTTTGLASLVTSWGTLSGFGSDDVTIDTSSVALTYASEDVGTHSLVLSGLALAGSDASSYSISDYTTTGEIIARDLTISGVTAANKVYDGSATGTADGTSALLTGLVTGDDLAFSSATASFVDANVGTSKQVNLSTTLSGSDLTNYNVIQQASTTANITARPIDVTADASQTKVYGASDPSLTFSLESNSAGRGLVSGDTFSGALTRESGDNAGTYAIQQGTVANSNYAINFITDDFSITSRPITITANASQSKVYGESDPVLAYTLESSGTNRGLVSGDTFAGALSRAAGSDVGDYAIGQGTLANSNYTVSFVSDDFSITARPITITADASQSKVYGESDPVLAYTLESSGTNRGLVSGDTFAGALSRAAGNDVGDYAIGQGTLANNNYAISFASDDFSITARPITITADASQSKVYGESDPVLAYTLESSGTNRGLVSGDTFAGALSRAAGSDVGDYAIGQGTLANNNYAISFASDDFAITPKSLSYTVAASNKVYDGTDTATTTLTFSGLVGSETLGQSVTASFDDRNVGNGKTVTVSAIDLADGTGTASNYSVSAGGTALANITPKTVTAQSNSTVQKVYDGTDTANGATVSLDGAISGDDVALSSTGGSFSQSDVGTGLNISVNGLALTGSDQGNYNYSGGSSLTLSGAGTITARPITITADASQSKVYGESDPVLAYTLESSGTNRGLVSGDTFAGALSRASGDNAGTYAIQQGTLANSNYAISFASDDFAITPKSLSYTVAASNKVYDGTDTAAATLTFSGLVGSETLGQSITASFNDRNVGTGKTVTVSAIDLVDGTGTASNYSVSAGGTALANITPKTVTAQSNSTVQKVYDGTNTASVTTVSLDGVISGDDVALSSTGGSFSQSDAGTGLNISVNGLALTGSDQGNYSYSGGSSLTLSGAGTITAKALSLSGVSIADKTYDGTRSATIDGAGSLSGLIAADVGQVAVNTTAITALFADKNVGTGKAVALSGGALSGLKSGNYTLDSIADSTGTIDARAITISGIAGVDRAYDQTTVAQLNTDSASGWITGDDIGLQVTGSFADPDIGQAKTITLQSQYTGPDASNYVITDQATAIASVLAAQAPISSPGRQTILGSAGARLPNLFTLESGVQPSYRSSDPSVIQVDPITGAVTVVGPGQAQVIAEVPASNLYAATTETVQVTVNDNSLAEPFSAPNIPEEDSVFPEGRQPITAEQRAQLVRLEYDPDPEKDPGVQRLGPDFVTSPRSVTNPVQRERAISRAVFGQMLEQQVKSFVFNRTDIGFGDVKVVKVRAGDGQIVLNLASDVLNHASIEEQLAVEFGVDELPEWISYNEATGELTLDVPAELGDALDLPIAATDQDGNLATTSLVIGEQAEIQELATFESVLPLNPTVVEVGNILNYEVPPETFTHENPNEQVRFEATLANNEPLPNWITFDAASKTFTGTPPESQDGQLDVIVTAVDSAQQKVQSALRIQLNDS